MDGWIKIHRKILDNPIVCKDADHFAIWNYLLLNASHKKMSVLFKGKKIELMPGQFITGRKKIAENFCISESKVKRVLLAFESDQQIDRQRSNQNSLITILKWHEYQDNTQQDGQQNDQPATSQRPASDQPVTTNKNIKNIRTKEYIKESTTSSTKEKATRFIPPTLEEVESYCLERKNNVDCKRFVNFYTAKNWYIGKNKMKDWKAAVRTWEKEDKGKDNYIKQEYSSEQINNVLSAFEKWEG